MPANRGTFSALLAPGLASVFFDQLKVIPMEHPQWINVEKSSRAYEEEYKMAGLGQMVQKGEGAVYTADSPIPGGTIRYTHLTYGLAFRVTEEMLEDDLYGVMNRMSKDLAKSAAYNRDVQATSVLNNGFNSSFTGLNGVELFSTAQVDLDGGTQANEPTTAADLDLPALQAAIESFKGWTDDRSFQVVSEPRWLIHATGDIWMANELLKTEKVPHSADNTVNIVKSMFGIEPKHLRHLTDTDAWMLLGVEHDLKLYNRVNDQFRNSDDPWNGDAIYTARHRISAGFGDWRHAYGSPGAA